MQGYDLFAGEKRLPSGALRSLLYPNELSGVVGIKVAMKHFTPSQPLVLSSVKAETLSILFTNR